MSRGNLCYNKQENFNFICKELFPLPFHIAVCDDETAQSDYLSELVSRWAASRGYSVRLSAFPSAEAFLFCYSAEEKFDLVLLDIEMEKMSGVELARRLREEDETLPIVFVTGYPDFMSEGYDVAALHYLMKPVTEERLFPVLDRAAKKLAAQPRQLLLETEDGVRRVPAGEILYAEAFAHTTRFVTAAGAFEARMGISEAESLLGEGFVRCHRSYVAGLSHIRSISRTAVTLDSGEALPLSRRLYQAVNQAFIRFYTR